MSTQDQQVREACNAIAAQIFLVAPHQQRSRHAGTASGASATASNASGSGRFQAAHAPVKVLPSPSTSSTFTTIGEKNGSSNNFTNSASLAAGESSRSHNKGTHNVSDARADELRRLSEAVVRDAMTLYRLCRQPGGNGTIIVPASSSSSAAAAHAATASFAGCSGGGGGGGKGAVSAAEEAAFCVLAVVMARVPQLWAALERRAALLQPRKPTLRFAPPVLIAPVVVKEVVKFHGRSRRLLPSYPTRNSEGCGVGGGRALPTAMSTPAGVGPLAATAAASAHAATAAGVVSSAGSPTTTTTTIPTEADVLSAQQAEAMAAAFFFKTMSPLERQRKSEIFAIQSTVDSTAAATKETPRSAAPPSSMGVRAGVEGLSDATKEASREGRKTSPSSRLPLNPLLSAVTQGKVNNNYSSFSTTKVTDVKGGLAASSRHREEGPPWPSSATSSSLFMGDAWNGWQGRRGLAGLQGQTVAAAVGDGVMDASQRFAAVGRSRWPSRSNSLSSTSSGSSTGSHGSTESSSHIHNTNNINNTRQCDPTLPGEGGSHRQAKASRKATASGAASAAAEAAVLDRLYRLATAADNASDESDGLDEDQHVPSTFVDERDTDGARRSGRGTGNALTSFATSATSSLFTGGKGMGLFSLAAMTTQVQDALHWGRLTTLVRFPLLFRGLCASPVFTDTPASNFTASAGGGGGTNGTAASVTLSPTSEALTLDALAQLNNVLGSSYTSAYIPTATTFSTPQESMNLSGPAAASALMDHLIASYGSPGSFLCPSRLRASSLLLPRPPSLVTDSYLWTRLLICSAWLAVYADSLIDPNETEENIFSVATKAGTNTEYSEEDGEEDGDSDDFRATSTAKRGGRKEKVRCAVPRVRPSAAVQNTVAYCVAVVKEARAISAGLAGTDDVTAWASPSSITAKAAHPRTGAAQPSSHVSPPPHSRAVCCPVCDRLVREERPVLWWSTLREDRAVLREQVCALLENGSATEAEGRVAAAAAMDGMEEGQGSRRTTAAPQLRGSAATGERVAALQARWAAFIMSKGEPEGPKNELLDSEHVGVSRVRREGESTVDQHGDEDTTSTAGVTKGDRMNEEEKVSDDFESDERSTLWAALTQRVAAATDLCTFLSTHPLSGTPSTSNLHNSRNNTLTDGRGGGGGGGDGGRTTRRRRTAAASHAKAMQRQRKRRRHSSGSSESSDEDTASSTRSGSTGSSSRSSDVDVGRPARGSARRGAGHSEAAEEDDEEEEDTRSTNVTGAFQGSRHAHEVAAAWEKLLCRCGWVNAAPPAPVRSSTKNYSRPTTRSTTTTAKTALNTAELASPQSALTPAACVQWASSLIAPTALPTSQQAAVLRRRLSRYTLADIVRILVLGRGGQWAAYAKLLFGEDVRIKTAVQASAPRKPEEATKRGDKPIQQGETPASAELSEDEAVRSSAGADTPPRREASMSLLEEDLLNSKQTEVMEAARNASKHDAVVPVTEKQEEEDACRAASLECERRLDGADGMVKSLPEVSPSPPSLTAPDNVTSLSSPRCSTQLQSASPQQTVSATEVLSPMKACAATPDRKSALPSIPLHVSPLSRHAAAAAVTQTVAVAVSAMNAAKAERDPTIALLTHSVNNHSQSTPSPSLKPSSSLLPTVSTAERAAETQNSTACQLADALDSSSHHVQVVPSASAATLENVLPIHAETTQRDESCDDGAVPRSQLLAQQTALRSLLRFHPRFPPLREEDAIVECGACFSLFHQDCIAPVQRDLMGQVFLCHTCRLRWARPYVEGGGTAGFMHQTQEMPF